MSEAPTSALPEELRLSSLRRRGLHVLLVLAAVGAILVLAPGLDKVRDTLEHARPGWLALAIVLEGLSCLCYVLMFRPVFCRLMSGRSAMEIGWSELGMGSLVPASGIGGLALGAWILRRDGMSAERIARRSVAFFLIKGAVNFVAVAVLGLLMFAGAGPHVSAALTLVPALMSITLIAGICAMPWIGPGPGGSPDHGRVRRGASTVRSVLVDGVSTAFEVLARREPALVVGAIGYWAFDNAVLWATFHAFGLSPPLTIVLMGYLIGQLGGLIPIPGGIGGIDGGLIGTLVVYGVGAAGATAAVLTYRVVLFWLPLLGGAIAFWSLQHALGDPSRPDLCREP